MFGRFPKFPTFQRPVLLLLAIVAVALGAMVPLRANASDEVEVRVERGQLVVRVRGDWHINPDYPWKLSVGDAKFDRTRFVFDEKTARLDAPPSGSGAVRGGVCAGDRCKSFTEAITIP
jgi:hypothetical protein